MTDNERELLQDEAVVLHVRHWQTADKYVVCFTKKYGKLRFIAYGARYVKNVQGRLLQPFACLNIEVQQGQKIDKLRRCELVRLPQAFDMQQMAYGAVAAELTAVLTEDREPQEELYALLRETLATLTKRNPRLVVLSFAIKLLGLTGFAPQLSHCVGCGRELSAGEDAWFSPLQGGALCADCRAVYAGEELEPCGDGTRRLWQWLERLDFARPALFAVRGGDLMALERLLYKFIFFQTDKQLNSLNFLNQMRL